MTDMLSASHTYLMDHAPLLTIRVDLEGKIQEANQYTRQLLDIGSGDIYVQDLIVDFNATFSLKDFALHPDKKHLLSFQTRYAFPKSFHCLFIPFQDEIVIYGHIDILDNETLNNEMLNMTRELSNLTRELHKKNAQLQDALDHVKTLQGILPICSHCHKIRNDEQVWDQLEIYLSDHTDVQLSHGICPDCLKKHYPDFSGDD